VPAWLTPEVVVVASVLFGWGAAGSAVACIIG
jgi:hypothetical protein